MVFAWRLAGAGLLALAAGVAHAASARVEQVGDAVVLQGRIDDEAAARAIALMQDARVTRLVITSGGGQVDAALDLAEAVHARGLDVEVPQACMSSCANYVLPAGRRKLLGRPGVVAWHGNMAHVLHLQRTGQAQWSEAEMAQARRLAQREAAFYARLGVDGFVSWFAKLPPYGIDEFFSLSPEDMAKFGIRDVEVRNPGLPVAGDLVQEVGVDWPRLEALRLRAATVP